MEGPGSSEERNRVVEDCESKVLGSESVKEERREGHSAIPAHWHLSSANSMANSMLDI